MKMNHVDVVFACKGRIWEKGRRGVKNGIFSSLVLLFRSERCNTTNSCYNVIFGAPCDSKAPGLITPLPSLHYSCLISSSISSPCWVDKRQPSNIVYVVEEFVGGGIAKIVGKNGLIEGGRERGERKGRRIGKKIISKRGFLFSFLENAGENRKR